MDIKDIKAIIDLMKKNSISEFELERQEFKIKLKRGNGGIVATHDESPLSISYAPQPQIPGSPPASLTASQNHPPVETEIKSPMIGTFYRSPSPDSAPYSEVGTEVTPETIVCIIEAMKVM